MSLQREDDLLIEELKIKFNNFVLIKIFVYLLSFQIFEIKVVKNYDDI